MGCAIIGIIVWWMKVNESETLPVAVNSQKRVELATSGSTAQPPVQPQPVRTQQPARTQPMKGRSRRRRNTKKPAPVRKSPTRRVRRNINKSTNTAQPPPQQEQINGNDINLMIEICKEMLLRYPSIKEWMISKGLERFRDMLARWNSDPYDITEEERLQILRELKERIPAYLNSSSHGLTKREKESLMEKIKEAIKRLEDSNFIAELSRRAAGKALTGSGMSGNQISNKDIEWMAKLYEEVPDCELENNNKSELENNSNKSEKMKEFRETINRLCSNPSDLSEDNRFYAVEAFDKMLRRLNPSYSFTNTTNVNRPQEIKICRAMFSCFFLNTDPSNFVEDREIFWFILENLNRLNYDSLASSSFTKDEKESRKRKRFGDLLEQVDSDDDSEFTLE